MSFGHPRPAGQTHSTEEGRATGGAGHGLGRQEVKAMAFPPEESQPSADVLRVPPAIMRAAAEPGTLRLSGAFILLEAFFSS